jgi:hypothetical protein
LVCGSSNVYDVYKRGLAEPPVHAEAIKARGRWIPGVGDAADISRYDGQQFLEIYRKLGLLLQLQDTRSVEANIHEVWTRSSTGRLKVFETMPLFRTKCDYALACHADVSRPVSKQFEEEMRCLHGNAFLFLPNNGRS